ncbi:MAG TPA: HmuY family protein [Gemmatimonadaceae bacterium]|nr:HmuY family protein [Gemmatimonadaceae bacterium]
MSIVAVAAIAAACSDSESGGLGPDPDLIVYDSITIDASTGWAGVRLGEPATLVPIVGDPSAAADWELAFNATAIMLNGGDAGPGDVAGFCLCANASATDDQVLNMTDASEQAAFLAVDESSIPSADASWQTDGALLAIDGWYNYNPQTHVVSAAPEKIFLVRSASGDAFVKFHVTDITGSTVTFEYAVAPSADQPFGAAQTAQATISDDAPAWFDLETGTVSSTEDPTTWDFAFVGYSIEVNGGSSGGGSAGAAALDVPFADFTSMDGIPSSAFTADGFGGVFVESPWFRYNLLGDDHHIWPTFNVYLIRTGDDVYKIQLTSYYDLNGSARRITFRYQKLGA